MIQKPHLRPFHLLLLCVALCAGQAHAITAADDITGSLEISPSDPTASWPDSGQSNELSANYTATISVTVVEEEEIDGVNYTLSNGPTATTGCTDSNVIWTESNTTYSITNTATDTASASMTLTCVWSSDNEADGGEGEASADIPGQAEANLQLLDSVVDWNFDRLFQMADGNEEIEFEVTFTDYNGFGLENWSLTEFTPTNATPQNPDWDIISIPANGPGWLLSASAVSEIASKGYVKIKYNDGSQEERISDDEIVFIEIETETAAWIPVDRKRRRLGVGEKVNITVIPESESVGSITWTTTDAEDAVLNTDDNDKPFLTAASLECSPKVKADFGDGVSHTIQFQVLEPEVEIAEKIRDLSLAEMGGITAQEQGAGMLLSILVKPDDVSFKNVLIKELPGPGVNKQGYYTIYTGGNTNHDPNPVWKKLDVLNRWSDEAAFFQWPKIKVDGVMQWVSGSYEWNIPVRWKLDGKEERDLPDRFQKHSITANDGTSVEFKMDRTSGIRTPAP